MAFSRGATGLSNLPSSFKSILGVTVESVPGIQVYLECIGTLGSFEMMARTLEYLSSVQLIPPPLEVEQECRDSFPDEAGKWILLRDEEGKPGLFLRCGGTLGVFLKLRRVCRGTY